MGTCDSLAERTEANSFLMPSPEMANSIAVDKLPITGDDLKAQESPRHPVRDYDSKDETFFDSRPWLNSDSEDDFASVNGDFTPSQGSTPLHPSFSHKALSLNKTLFDKKTLVFNSEQSPVDKKKSLFELFRDSVRRSHSDIDEHNKCSNQINIATIRNGDFENKKPRKSIQCCFPRLLVSRSFIERKKKMCSKPALVSPNL